MLLATIVTQMLLPLFLPIIEVNAANNDGDTALVLAERAGHIDIAAALGEAANPPNCSCTIM